jgi:uncharacterized protein YyaL (SSP411 family)
VGSAILVGHLPDLKPFFAGTYFPPEDKFNPLLDTKILTAWNGLMIDAYAYGYQVLGEETYPQTARQAAALVLERLRDGEGHLRRSFREGAVKYAAYQEDYAFLARGLWGLYRATGEARYLEQAEELARARGSEAPVVLLPLETPVPLVQLAGAVPADQLLQPPQLGKI